MVRTPDEWAGSSYRATVGLDDVPCWLTTDWLLAAFAEQCSEARGRYMAFVAAGKNQLRPWKQLKNQTFLGSEAYVASLQRSIHADAPL